MESFLSLTLRFLNLRNSAFFWDALHIDFFYRLATFAYLTLLLSCHFGLFT
jgi:hypothetical protein